MSTLTETLERRNDKVKEVLKKAVKPLSTTEIAARSNLEYYRCLIALESLYDSSEVERTVDGDASFWRLKKK